ncbi:MAG: hypothetical protein IRY85_17960 [Micromonosporaceae bacterium]|nr:hypothetical protein [Micromonosporaceae bacterium]
MAAGKVVTRLAAEVRLSRSWAGRVGTDEQSTRLWRAIDANPERRTVPLVTPSAG